MTIIAVFGSSSTAPGTPAWLEAEGLGRAIADRGWAVATGGYGGTMEAVSSGAAVSGGVVLGITAPSVFAARIGANRHVTEERPAPTLVSRIAELVEGTDATIALDGSLGTLTELAVAWNVAYVAADPKPVVAVGARWKGIVAHLESSLPTGHGLVDVVTDAMTAIDVVASRLVTR